MPDASPGARVQRPGLLDRLQDDLVQAGYDGMRPRTLVAACLVALVLVFLIVLAGTTRGADRCLLRGDGRLCAARAGADAGTPAARGHARPVAGRRRQHRLRGASRARPAGGALRSSASADRRSCARPFAAFAEDYRATGRFHECLDRLKDRLSDPVGDRLVESLRIAREVGGSDLGRLLRTLSTFLREDARTRAELETRQGWTVNAARLAVGAPWLVLALIATRGESVQAYSTATGTAVLAAGAAVSVAAYRIMLHIGRLPEDERVLR